MTISSTDLKNTYTCNGSQTVFPYTFKIFTDSDMEVILYTVATGAEQTLTLTTDYTVSGAGTETGRNVTTTTTYSSDYQIVLRPNVPDTQTVDLVNNDGSDAEVIETAFDKLLTQIKQVKERSNRAISQDATATSTIEFPGASADKVIGWNADGDGLENKTLADLDSVEIATDTNLGTSDTKVPSQNAVKTYVDNIDIPTGGFDFSISSGTGTDCLVSGSDITVTHGLNISAPDVSIFDSTNNEQVVPDDVRISGTNMAIIDMSSFSIDAGNWAGRIK